MTGTGQRPIAAGKTKVILPHNTDPRLVRVVSKGDITAGDGAKHDVIIGKGELSTTTTSNTFALLQACGVPVAFVGQDSPNSFVAPKCTMLPYEVVVRRKAYGSYLERNPSVQKETRFDRLVVEFYLKTKDKKWKDHPLVRDDPYMIYHEGGNTIDLYDPHAPLDKPFLVLPELEVFGYTEEWMLFPEMDKIARKAFLVLEKAWRLEGGNLVDFKIEFGFGPNDHLLIADVIDADSCRVIFDGVHIDKQAYREGGSLDEVAGKFRRFAEITGRFKLPRQQIILWRGSEKDDVSAFVLPEELRHQVGIMLVTCSMHKQPVAGINYLETYAAAAPDSVVIAYVGRSNGAGPTLSAHTTWPVITVPASVGEFRDDVWSSLRMPSGVPVMTVLEPSNAVLAALHILSARNPAIHAYLRGIIEDRKGVWTPELHYVSA